MRGTNILFSNIVSKEFFDSSRPVWGKIVDTLHHPEGTQYLVKCTDPEIAHAIDTTIVLPKEIEMIEV